MLQALSYKLQAVLEKLCYKFTSYKLHFQALFINLQVKSYIFKLFINLQLHFCIFQVLLIHFQVKLHFQALL